MHESITDFPVVIVMLTIWAYWLSVGVMVARARRKTRQLAGLVPEQRLEQRMWMIWVPLVIAWIVLPWLALRGHQSWQRIPSFAVEQPVYITLRWIAALGAVACLALTAVCWARMGKDWSMAVRNTRGELITDGLFAHVRHPIYALSILMMICTAVIVPTIAMTVIAIVHIALMNIKARNEERHLLAMHGEDYRKYLLRTGRFFPGAVRP